MPIDPKQVARILSVVRTEPHSARSDALLRECGNDSELRKHLEDLLASESASATDETFIPEGGAQSSAQESAAPLGVTASAKSNIRAMPKTSIQNPLSAPSGVIADRYVLQQKIGEGGMGEVWIARQSEPVQRNVALKLIKPGMASRDVLVRFEQERQALAMMEHPNIASVFDAGQTPTGQPFFAMELVNGAPLTKFCDEEKLSPKARLELFVPICQAVQHAHQKGIVHRDLKPANILVTFIDGKAVPKVIDFGVAKATSGKLARETMATELGAVVGTLEYMSPEQAGTTGNDVDTRADIYSLGVVLYELMTGLRPFDGAQLRRAALSEVIRIIREDDPARPSTRLSTSDSLPSLAAVRQTEPKKLMAQLRGELDWVIMKCLEKNRDRRYETASGLARDIQRYLSDEPVEARPPSAAYRLHKFVTRNRTTVLAGGLVLVSLIGGVIGTTWGLFVAREQTEIAVENARQAEAARKSESEQRHLAEKANQQAFEALESFTSDLMGNLLGSRSELSETELAVLTNAAKQWEVFAESRGSSVEARLIRADGAKNLAVIQNKLGLFQDVVIGNRKTLTIRTGLVAEFPDNTGFREKLALGHQDLGGGLRAIGQRAEAAEHFQQAAELFSSLRDMFPNEARHQENLSESLISLGNVARDFSRWDEAREHYSTAQQLQEQLVETFPAILTYKDSLARSHWGLAALNKRQERTAESTGHYRKAIAIYQRIVADLTSPQEILNYRSLIGSLLREFGVMLGDSGDDLAAAEELAKAVTVLQQISEQFPSVTQYQSDRAKAHRDYGQVLRYLERKQEARSQLDAAVGIQKPLAEAHPTVLPYQAELGITYRMLGDLTRDADSPTEAFEWYARAIDILTATYVQDREYTLVKNSLCTAHRHRAETCDHFKRHNEALMDWDKVLKLCHDSRRDIYRTQQADSRLRSGDVKGALKELAELENVTNPNSFHWFNFARLYAIASEKLPEQKENLATRAVKLLEKSVTLGFNDSKRMIADDDLASLQSREDFKRLLKQL